MSIYTSNGGSAVVGDGTVTIQYEADGAIIRPGGGKTTPCAYIPMPNPPNTTDKLQKVSIECDVSDASIDQAMVYFGKELILHLATRKDASGYCIDVIGTSSKADSEPYGIDVTLFLNLPNVTSYVKLYSVTLTFSS